ncbi:replication protein A 70 kDa DNA-binding subunit A-like [Cryptomeria japonica]|uniref:replication protein A 70 kDa DNA-binding subunit A-like n=1 Tax=Cryptomeria japonica TaxID=3369 RepID=UPI0027DA3BB4|nr:replication protein A 70 kDa DNA-binding subunit A-like [Cryptomeria japonica]
MTNDQDQNKRYKVVLSDGTYMQLAILPTRYTELLHSETLKIGFVLLLATYACRYVWSTRIIITFTLEVKITNCPLLGKPRYLFKEKEQQMLVRETPPPSKRALKFGVDLPSPQSNAPDNISPIKSLNPYQSKWTIKGQVTNNRKMHQYSTSKANGQVFSFDIIDDEGCEIRVTCFDEIAELHYHRVEEGAYYVISKGSIKDANTKYNKLNSHLEIVLIETSVLKRCVPNVAASEKKSRYTPINELLTAATTL